MGECKVLDGKRQKKDGMILQIKRFCVSFHHFSAKHRNPGALTDRQPSLPSSRQQHHSRCRRRELLIMLILSHVITPDLIHGLQRLGEVGEDVVDVLHANREANGGGGDVLLREFFGTHLGMGGGVGVNDEALHIGDVGEEGEDLEIVDEAPGIVLRTGNLEGEDAARTLGVVLLIKLMVGMRGERRMAHALHLGMSGEEINNAKRVLHMALNAQGERLYALE